MRVLKLFKRLDTKLPAKLNIAVVVSTWTGNPPEYLQRLIDSINKYDAGTTYDLFLCANGEDYTISETLQCHFNCIYIRENSGYNLGAWDYAWRRLPQYTHFLFLQDDCIVKKNKWLSRFVSVFNSSIDVGLVGEYFSRGWDHSWEVLTTNTAANKSFTEQKRKKAVGYNEQLKRWGIDPGDRASHLTSVVHYTSRKILEEVDGYNLGQTYQEAVAAEIGFSRKLIAKGYKLVQVGRSRHSVIAHPQWPSGSLIKRWCRVLKMR